jgi:hypothetical protein
MFGVHPGSGFFSIPDPGVKKAPDPRSGSATTQRYTVGGTLEIVYRYDALEETVGRCIA